MVSAGAAALVADLDDDGWPGLRELAAEAACPVLLLSSFGSEPDAPPGSDLTVSAASGLLHLSGTPADEEGRPAVLVRQQADALAGSFAALWVGALALSATRTGTLELSKLECVAITCSWAAMQWLYAGNIPSRFGDSPFQPSGLFEARDGLAYTVVATPGQWTRFVEAMGNPEWASWEVFSTPQGRVDAVDVLLPRVGEWIARHTREEILELSVRHRLPFALANRPEEATALQEQLSGQPDHAGWLYRTTRSPDAAAPSTVARDPRRPLAGSLVLDLSSVWATPLAGQFLAALGARVIKIESRRHPDNVRRVATYRDPDDGLPEWDRSGGFREVNRGKESVELDLTTDEGRAILHRLVPQADVLLSNLLPGGDRERLLGIAEDQLWALNPGLVIGRLSAFEADSRLEGLPGYGYSMLLMCGFGYNGPGRPWTDRSVPYSDPLTAAALALGLLRALEEADRSGRGAVVRSTLFGVSAALMREFEAPGEPDTAFEGCLPCRHDEWIAVTCRSASDLAALTDVLGVTPEDGALEAALAQRAVAWEAQSLQVALRRRGVVAERVLDVRELAREGRLTGSGMLHIPEGETHLHFASPWVLDGERIDAAGRAPRLGEHTASVLQELAGVDAAAFPGLVERGVSW